MKGIYDLFAEKYGVLSVHGNKFYAKTGISFNATTDFGKKYFKINKLFYTEDQLSKSTFSLYVTRNDQFAVLIIPNDYTDEIDNVDVKPTKINRIIKGKTRRFNFIKARLTSGLCDSDIVDEVLSFMDSGRVTHTVDVHEYYHNMREVKSKQHNVIWFYIIAALLFIYPPFMFVIDTTFGYIPVKYYDLEFNTMLLSWILFFFGSPFLMAAAAIISERNIAVRHKYYIYDTRLDAKDHANAAASILTGRSQAKAVGRTWKNVHNPSTKKI